MVVDETHLENPVQILVNTEGNRVYQSCEQGKVSPQSIAVWPSRVEHWVDASFKRRHLLPAFSLKCRRQINTEEKLHILGVKPDSIIKASPDSKTALSVKVSVLANQGEVEWLLNGDRVTDIESDGGAILKNFVSGINYLSVFNGQGQMGEVQFYVR